VQVEGVRSLTSASRQGRASITVELDMARDVDLALQDVQAKVSQAQRRLPNDLDPPVISKTNPEDNPIIWVGLSGPFPPQVLADYARYRVSERLQTLPGIGEIQLGGYLERNIRIWIDATRLDAKNLTVTDVLAALQREHVELPAGRIEAEGREVNVRVLGEALDLASLRRIVVRDVSGSPVYLEDVALVEDGFEDIRRLSRVDGNPAIGFGVKKQRGANAVAVAQRVRAELRTIQATLPDGMLLGINFDSTQFIEDSVHEIELELMLSVLLTAVVCWLFLGSLSSTLNVILAIPMSLLGTIAVIYFLGFTLNTFTLLGLALAVGIVVDDAIMVLENIVRHGEMGKDRKRAALEGTAEITFAALAATLAGRGHFHPRRLHEGNHWQILPAVRGRAVPGGAAVLPRSDHPGAGALLAVPEYVAPGTQSCRSRRRCRFPASRKAVRARVGSRLAAPRLGAGWGSSLVRHRDRDPADAARPNSCPPRTRAGC
jgi:multidrug efflux pump subunit AcrB